MVSLEDGRRLNALTYVADPCHPQYVGGLEVDDAASIIRTAEGSSGPNADYVFNTVEHLKAIGIRDALLEKIAAHVGDGAEAT